MEVIGQNQAAAAWFEWSCTFTPPLCLHSVERNTFTSSENDCCFFLVASKTSDYRLAG